MVTWTVPKNIAIGVIVFLIQQYKVNQKKKLLYYLTAEIEKFRHVDEDKFHELTKNIQHTMVNQRLEGQLSKILKEEGMNKT